MIERFDTLDPSTNPVFAKFRSEHIRRYQIAADYLNLAFAGSLDVGGVESEAVEVRQVVTVAAAPPRSSPTNRQPLHRTFRRSPLIIDAAAGCGYGFDYLAKVGRYIGLDCSVEAVRGARRAFPAGDFRLADLEDSESLTELNADAFVSLETAEHLDDPSQFLRTVRASLRLGAPFVFSAPTSLTMDFDPFHRRDWDEHRWGDELTAAGFKINRIVAMPFEAKFTDFLGTVPTTIGQKFGVLRFLLKNKRYAKDRWRNWICQNRFVWCSHLFCCAIV